MSQSNFSSYTGTSTCVVISCSRAPHSVGHTDTEESSGFFMMVAC